MDTEVMDTTVAVQELTEKVLRLEQEVAGLRRLEQEVTGLRQEVGELKNQPVTNGQTAITDHPVDQEELSQAIRQAFKELGITARAKGVAYLRQMYKEAGLENLEMSRQLVEARDE